MNQNKNNTAGKFAISILLTAIYSALAVAETVTGEQAATEAATTDTPVTTDAPVVDAVAEQPAATDTAKEEAAAGETRADDTAADDAKAADVETEPAATGEVISLGNFVVDTSNWKCEECPFEEGLSGELELGIGHVSDDSFKFGEYNGLYEEGAYAIASASLRYRNQQADYFDLSVRDGGLETRSLNIKAGRQGSYGVFLGYDEISHYISDTAQTPYSGDGGTDLSLPASWVPAGDTSGMSELAASLHNSELSLQRKRLDLGMSFIPASAWQYDVKYRHETREGTRRSAGAFYLTSAQLVEPVDYVTEQVDVSASYVGKQWQATLAYYGSFFSNDNTSLTWENAFDPPVVGADTGERALPPDNLFNQILMSVGYQASAQTRISGDLAVGRMEQDETFLDVTQNTDLTVPALPRNSLDGQVDTLTGDLRVISALSDKLRLNASYNYSDRDNKTPQEEYTWVTTDAFVKAPRTNQPYSFTRNQAKVAADYRVDSTTKVAAGIDHDRLERTLQEVAETTEVTSWGKLTVRGKEFTDMTVKLAHAERNASSYQPVADVDPAQNPLLTKYNMADRTRNTAGFSANAMASETIGFGFSMDYANDDYSKSVLGLTEAEEMNINVDVSVMLSDNSSVHMFYGHQRITSTQQGSQTTTAASWYAENDDRVNSAGFGYTHRLIEDKLDVGIDYVMTRSRGAITVFSAAPEDFPELVADLDSIRLYADLRLKENMSLHASYWYENYDATDWALEGVNADTISNVISFGDQDPSYNVNVINLSLRYKF